MKRCDLCKHWDYHYPDDMGVCTVDGGPGQGQGFAVPAGQAMMCKPMYEKYRKSGHQATTCDTYCDKFATPCDSAVGEATEQMNTSDPAPQTQPPTK